MRFNQCAIFHLNSEIQKITSGAIRKCGEQFLFLADVYPGSIYKMKLDGTVVGTIGSAGKDMGHFGDIHELACPDENTIYAAEELNWRVSKIKITP